MSFSILQAAIDRGHNLCNNIMIMIGVVISNQDLPEDLQRIIAVKLFKGGIAQAQAIEAPAGIGNIPGVKVLIEGFQNVE